MAVSSIKNIDELPVCLKISHVAEILGISRGSAFNLARQPDFPSIRVGKKRIVVPRDKLIIWIENQAAKPLE